MTVEGMNGPIYYEARCQVKRLNKEGGGRETFLWYTGSINGLDEKKQTVSVNFDHAGNVDDIDGRKVFVLDRSHHHHQNIILVGVENPGDTWDKQTESRR